MLERPNPNPNQLPGMELEVIRIKWMSDGKGATIFAGEHSTRKAKETPSIPVEFGDAEPPL